MSLFRVLRIKLISINQSARDWELYKPDPRKLRPVVSCRRAFGRVRVPALSDRESAVARATDLRLLNAKDCIGSITADLLISVTGSSPYLRDIRLPVPQRPLRVV